MTTMAMTVIFDRSGNPVETVCVELVEGAPHPEIVMWGARAFALRADGRYVEGTLVQVFTRRELESMP